MHPLLAGLKNRLVVSCQPVTGGPLDSPAIVAAYVKAVVLGGAAGLRIEGFENLRAARAATSLPVIGLVKRDLPDTPVRITPFPDDLRRLAELGADILAFDATARRRPASVPDLTAAAHAAGRLAMADIATLDEAVAAMEAGCDVVGTTLAGYTGGPVPDMPDFEVLSAIAARGIPVIAEGRVRTPEEAAEAMRRGAHAVVVGSAITRPELATEWFAQAVRAGSLARGAE
jgi:N-acetylmannosamine-6-phosphate 2-epimerase/N-acetylmannosamine kinase